MSASEDSTDGASELEKADGESEQSAPPREPRKRRSKKIRAVQDESAESEAAALEIEAKPIRCPSCRKIFSADKKFCPYCGRSREELKELTEQNNLIMDSTREASSAWNKLHTMATFYVVLLVLNFVSAYVLPAEKVWGLLVADLGIVIASFCWAASARKYLSGRFKPGFTLPVLLLIPLGGYVTYLVTAFNNYLLIMALGLRDASERIEGLEGLFELLFPLPILIVSICVMPGIFEEIFFRGLVQGTLEEMMSKREALWVQAVIFAIAHLNPIGFFTYLVFLGLYFGWLRNKSGSLIPGMLAHFAHNLIVVLNERYHFVQF